MKKAPKKYPNLMDEPLSIVSDFEAIYETAPKSSKRRVAIEDFTYNHFQKIAAKAPFTLNEWADLLYISERSLHRYAKDDGGFNGLQIERILLLETLIDTGNALFEKEGFRQWVQSRPFSLHGAAVMEQLTTHAGIQEVIDLLHRLEHGIPA
ncbi:MAG: DUF2384 domain-containing protein [Niabella sp.]|nr:DUF2384 domain-containing protein [Niabella sp.]